MSSLRSQMIRMASELPKGDPTRRKLLAAVRTSGDRKAGSYGEILWRIIDEREFYQAYRGLLKDGDEQSAELARQVVTKLRDALDLSRGESEALGRIANVVKNHKSWDVSLQRNNIFKAANSLGISLPSGMF